MGIIQQLLELSGPEYHDRHLFIARFRLVIFLGFWGLYLYFYHSVLGQTYFITYTVTACFLLTNLAYYFIIKNKFLVPAFVAAVVADLAAITMVVYMTEGPYSDFFTIYVVYAFAGGVFYNYILALVLAASALVTYGIYLYLAEVSIIPPLIIDYGEHVAITAHTPFYHVILLIILLMLAVYGVRIASHFSQQRERMLEKRNKELTALAKMSASIRSTISFDEMIRRVLDGVSAGLDLDVPMLALFDYDQKKLNVYLPREHPLVMRGEQLFGHALGHLSTDLDSLENPILQSLKKEQIVFRKDLMDAVRDFSLERYEDRLKMVQDDLSLNRVVAVPLVAEHRVFGALAGFVKQSYVHSRTVKTLEAFANQAALSIEAVLLIDRLKKANKELVEANKVKSEFLATMSHELRTPLTAIIGFSELLLEGVMGPLSEEQQDSLKEVLNNGATLLDLINNLLDMAKIEAGKMELEVSPFDLQDLLKRLTQTISSLIQKKNQKLELIVPKQVPLIHADEKKMQQVILNLLSNANKFTPEGGLITVRLKYESGKFEISVKDTGIGIRIEDIEKLFDMFQQVDSSVTRSHGGTGLGLALAKQFVELHNGVVEVTSEYGKGANFKVVLPEKAVI